MKTDMFSSRKPGFIYKAIVNLFEQGERPNYNLIDRTMQEASCIGNNIFVFRVLFRTLIHHQIGGFVANASF